MLLFDERPGARRSTTDPPTFETEYVLEGEFDSGAAKLFALANVPMQAITTEGILFRQNLELVDAGHKLYYFPVSYGKKNKEVGSYQFSFSTSGGTLHRTHSLLTVAKYPPGATTPEHKQAIDVDREGRPRGTTVTIPVCKLSYAFKHPQGVVNEAMAVALARVTGMVNDSVWHGFQAGEALFLGADGSDGTDAEAEVHYHIVAEENLQDLIIGDIINIDKQGHDFLWVWVEDAVNANAPVVKPRAVYVERLYRRTNFTAALGF